MLLKCLLQFGILFGSDPLVLFAVLFLPTLLMFSCLWKLFFIGIISSRCTSILSLISVKREEGM